jgi:hypothetical protein
LVAAATAPVVTLYVSAILAQPSGMPVVSVVLASWPAHVVVAAGAVWFPVGVGVTVPLIVEFDVGVARP